MLIERSQIATGQMAFAAGRLIKIGSITDDMAECLWFDSRGNVHSRDFYLGSIVPFWAGTSPRSMWPEVNEIPEEIAKAADEAAAKRRREKARKPKRSLRAFRTQRA
jgi:hypothetical protein